MLEPERVRTYELSVAQRVGTNQVQLGWFYNRYRNLVENYQFNTQETMDEAARRGIPYSPELRFTQYRNADTITNYGTNAGVEGAMDSLRYGANVTAAIATRNGSQIVQAPRVFGNARVSYDLGGDAPIFGFAARYQGRMIATTDYSPPVSVTPALDLRVSATGQIPTVDGLSYGAYLDWSVIHDDISLFTNYQPYTIGPLQHPTASQPDPVLIPREHYRAVVGLRYDF
jgi:hypothetical protein